MTSIINIIIINNNIIIILKGASRLRARFVQFFFLNKQTKNQNLKEEWLLTF